MPEIRARPDSGRASGPVGTAPAPGSSLAGVLVSVLVAALATGAAPAPIPRPETRGPAETVVLVSVDGLRWDYPVRWRSPNLGRMAAEGAAARLVPPFPANTFPAHATLATGVHPDRHGIMNNNFLDRGRGAFRMEDDPSWLLAEPLWVTAEKQGAPAAVYHWVASSGPWRGVAATRRYPFDRSVPDAEKAGTIVEWLGLPGPGRPRLIMSYWHGPDHAAHRQGPDGPDVARRVSQTDRLIGRILEAIGRSARATTLIVVSDHGMSAVESAIRIDLLIREAGSAARSHASGGTANIYCGDRGACARAAAALRSIEGVSVFALADLPPGLRYAHPGRTGDLVAVAPAGAYFADGPAGSRPVRGMHGYDPGRLEMQGVFRAWGAGIRRGAARERVDAVDVAPLICRLLGITGPAGIDGKVPEEFLEPVKGPGGSR